jgi:dephospho-CoA kinase
VGVTGVVGSGKSEFARALAEDPRARLLEADRIGHEALAPGGPLVAAVVRRFGPEVRGPDGGIQRPVLARMVFEEPGGLEALNALVHPWLIATLRRRMARLRRQRGVAMVVVDAALLAEWGLHREMDRVVVVEAPARRRRLWLRRRGWSEAQIRGREAAQWPAARKRAVADVVVANDGDLTELRARARRLAGLWLHYLGRGGGS